MKKPDKKDYFKIYGLRSELEQVLKMETFLLKEKYRIQKELEKEEDK